MFEQGVPGVTPREEYPGKQEDKQQNAGDRIHLGVRECAALLLLRGDAGLTARHIVFGEQIFFAQPDNGDGTDKTWPKTPPGSFSTVHFKSFQELGRDSVAAAISFSGTSRNSRSRLRRSPNVKTLGISSDDPQK